jgi:sugar lactone lactonase YvrE
VRSVSVEVAIDVRAELGEGPRWDAAAGRLLWVDVEGRSLHVFDPERDEDRTIPLGARVGVGQPMSDGRVLVALADRLAALDLDDESVETLVSMPHGPGLRLNDGACDPDGRFWVGSLDLEFTKHAGSLYVYDGHLREVLTGVTISNGIGWSPDGSLMYYIDTRTHNVDVFDFDGLPSGRRRFATIERAGWPDGLALDDEGGVWVALWGGSSVRRYAPDAALDDVIDVPALNVTSCCFGGPDRNRLFITTASPDGRVYATDLPVTGPPAQPSRSTAPSEAEPTSRR